MATLPRMTPELAAFLNGYNPQIPYAQPQQPDQQTEAQPVTTTTTDPRKSRIRRPVSNGKPRTSQQPSSAKERASAPPPWPWEHLQDLSQGHPKAMADVLMFLVFFLAGLVFIFTVGPYIKFVKLLTGVPAIGELLTLISSLPFIGGIMSFFGGMAATIAGTALWILVQIMELWELTMTLSPTYVSRVVTSTERAKQLANYSPNSKAARLLVNFYRHPLDALELAMTLRSVGLLIELAIGWFIIPPCEGGLLKFFFYLITFQFGQINWANLAIMAMLLFAMEGCYRLYVRVRDWRYHNDLYEKEG